MDKGTPCAAPVDFADGAAATGEPIAVPRRAASWFFLADGVGFGTWAALIPSFKARFGLDEAGLSMALLGMVIGALISMPLIGRFIARRGSRASLSWVAPAFCGVLAVLVVTPNFPLLVVAATLFGACKGALDVSVNSQAIAIENRAGRPIMSTFQALWSLGGLFAAVTVGMALKHGAAPQLIGLATAAVLLTLTLWHSRRLLGGDAAARPASSSRRFERPSGALLRIGALAFLVLFAEGVMMDWSAVYSASVGGAASWLAPLAYGVFSLFMATGRLLGDRVTARFGAATVLRGGSVLTAAGVLLMVGWHAWPATFAGLALTGLGLANLVPILLGAGGRAHPHSAGQGVATVSMIGYFGFLAGPPAIGALSHVIGLAGAFAIVLVFAFFLTVGGPKMLARN